MIPKIDAFTLINFSPPGTMIYAEVGFSKPVYETSFLIKEIQPQIAMISETAHIEFNSCSILIENVTLILMLLQFDYDPGLTYAGFFDYNLSETSKRCLKNLATQEFLRILFFNGEPKPAKRFSLKNKLQAGFRLYLQNLNNKAPWSMEDFEYAKLTILGQFPDINSLWHSLKEKNMN